MDFAFKYSNYSSEEFKGTKYLELSEALLKLAKSDDDREMMESMLTQGGVKDFSVNDYEEYIRPNNSMIESRKRVGYAALLATYPETFKHIVDNKIVAFHGTNSFAIASIITDGLKPFGTLEKEGIEMPNGEKETMVYRAKENSSDIINVTNDLETIYEFATSVHGLKNKNVPNYGVVIGIKKEHFDSLSKCKVRSACVECGIRNQVPPEMIDFIGVPEDRVKFVKKLVSNRNIAVMPMPIESKDRFYNIEENGNIYIDKEKYEKVLLNETVESKSFGKESFKELGKKVGVNKMLDAVKRLLILKNKENNKKSSQEIGDD